MARPAGIGRPSPLVLVGLIAAMVVVAIGGLVVLDRAPTSVPPAVPAVDLGAGWQWQPQAGPLDLGVTHTQQSLNPGSPAAALDRGRAVLDGTGRTWQNQHLMGFGALNPEPSPGVYDWASLDGRMALIRATGGQTVLTACCAPDWMKGGQAGRTDWSTIERAPLPEHYGAYADLVASAVQRYPQVRAVLVWNEFKGFFDPGTNRWNYEAYTALYNEVYRAVKAVRPDVEVGGPYAPLTSVPPGSAFASPDLVGSWGAADRRVLDAIDYWTAHNVGSDFVVVDAPTNLDRLATPPPTVEVGGAKFADVTAWLRQRTGLPVWWAEFYPTVPSGAEGGPSSPASSSATLAAVAAFARSDATVALLWGPEGSDLPYAALWTSTADADGGRPTPLTRAWDWLVPRLAAGRVEIGRSTDSTLLAFRAPDGAVVVNLDDREVPLGTGGGVFPPWGIAVQPP